MTLEGTLRDHVYTNGAWRDSLLFSILENEYWAIHDNRPIDTDQALSSVDT